MNFVLAAVSRVGFLIELVYGLVDVADGGLRRAACTLLKLSLAS